MLEYLLIFVGSVYLGYASSSAYYLWHLWRRFVNSTVVNGHIQVEGRLGEKCVKSCKEAIFIIWKSIYPNLKHWREYQEGSSVISLNVSVNARAGKSKF